MARCVVVDMASRADPIISQLKKNGIHTVFRYYASGFQSSLPEKRLTRDEKDKLLDAGLALGIVYQFNNNQLASMTAARGRADATFSIDYALDTIGQPEGSAIYFGVDGDWWTNEDQKKVRSYFSGVNDVFRNAGSPFKIGVYGSGTTCRNLLKEGLAQLTWLPLSTGWSGSRDYYNTGAWTFYQNYHGLRVGGRYTDTNIVNPQISGIGTFDKEGVVEKVSQPSGVFAQRTFVTTSSARLKKEPDADSTTLKRLRKRQNVRVLAEANGWATLDVDETGTADGFCQRSYLTDLGQMP